VEFINIVLLLLPFAAAVWALITLHRLASVLDDVTERLERIEKLVGRTRTDALRDR
jgi:hypothetical protein